MRIRKRCPAATSAGGVQGLVHGLNIPPPPHHHHLTHQVYANYVLENLRQWPRSEGAVAAAAATSPKKDERVVSNCRSSTTATTAAAISAAHDSTSNISFIREQREALIRDLTGDAKRSCSTTVVAGKADARCCVDTMNPNSSTAEAAPNFIQSATKLMPDSDQEGSRRELNNALLSKQAALISPSRFRPSAAAAPLSQSKREPDKDKNAESETAKIQRHILSNWSMPSLKGLRRSRFYSPMHQPQVPTAGSNNGNPYPACKKELVHQRSHTAPAAGDSSSSDDNTFLQDVQTWPKVGAVKLVGGPKASFNQISGYDQSATLEQNMDLSKGEQAWKKMMKKQQLAQEGVMLSCNSRADNKVDDGNTSNCCAIGGPKQLEIRSRFQIGPEGEITSDDEKQQESRGRSTHEDGSDSQHGLGITSPNNIKGRKYRAGISKIGVAHQELPSTYTSPLTGGNDLKLKTADDTNTIACNSACKLKKTEKAAAEGAGNKSGKRNIAGAVNHGNEADQVLDSDQLAMNMKARKKGIFTGAGSDVNIGTGTRWRKKCRPVFRSINDIQRRASLITTDGQGLPRPAPAPPRRDRDHRPADDRVAVVPHGTRIPQEDEEEASTNSSSVAYTTSTDQYRSSNNASKISCSCVDNKYRDGGNPMLPKLNSHVKRNYMTAPDLEQPVISRPSKRRAAAAAAAALQPGIDTSPPAHHDVVSQSLYRCPLNSDPFEWRPDYSHFV